MKKRIIFESSDWKVPDPSFDKLIYSGYILFLTIEHFMGETWAKMDTSNQFGNISAGSGCKNDSNDMLTIIHLFKSNE